MNYHDILIRPLNTEKTNILLEEGNKVTFEVAPKANRIEVKKAIEAVFNVKILSVHTQNVKGKVKQRGRIIGKRKDWKKAVATLMPGEKIEFFDGV
ncbi:LSU ribosomal protein L23P [Desulfobotulus alkaliphilus]|uniref:Large ribosomal subunit protein uL23 n=1 Tax=Desulfobotulus alkaliphilus TaxID=622671 RepID=A0A562RRC3_9BACT|nr:50S ribosomal protein L23 [Desulfobotulus alkaliphilus]TWI71625.1 LSU ribosomal protein L23P [Desulfobotulus alkaliphilus]